MISVAVLLSITILINLTRSAQNLQNNADNLSRSLKQLHLHACLQTGKITKCITFGTTVDVKPTSIVINKAHNAKQKEVLQILRVILNQPIYIKAFGAVNVNMSLVPACFGLIMSYTVVALQFNNVV
ncbi:uncharacterized protein LOC133525297 [Cydia pomonella]|uniref:uncharacterized protein LOC133525297 n=1 Tax=Cydia pomonella TaxID=82600 RepID=UPI002ADDD731|nr:uncharacterized protein LOC133525297 [Cydia pomonella]